MISGSKITKKIALLSAVVLCGATITCLFARNTVLTTFVDRSAQYELRLEDGFVASPYVNGTVYQKGTDFVRVQTFDDRLMSSEVLFSDKTIDSIKENYHETYDIEEKDIIISKIKTNNGDTLKVKFSDHGQELNQYYWYAGSKVLLMTTNLGNSDDLANNLSPI